MGLLEKCLITKKKSVGMLRRLNAHAIMMLFLILVVLNLLLGVSGVFSNHEKELEATLQVQLNNAIVAIEDQSSAITAESIALSEEITKKLTAVLIEDGSTFEEVEDNPKLITAIQEDIYHPMHAVLQGSPCSGVYAFFDTTVNSTLNNANQSKTGIYLRFVNLNAENPVHQSVVMFRGIPDIARREDIELHNRWNLESDIQYIPWYQGFMNASVSNLYESYGFSNKLPLTDTWEDMMLVSVPILDYHGTVVGICGAEISSLCFKNNLPTVESSYGPIMTILAPIVDDEIYISKGMVGGIKHSTICHDECLTVTKLDYFNRYTGLSGDYIGKHQMIDLPSVTGETFAVITLLPESGYQALVNQRYRNWCMSATLFFVFSLVLILVFSKHFMVPIEKTMKRLSSQETVEPSGMQELDEIIKILQEKSQQEVTTIPKEVLPQNIDEMIETFTQRVQTLTPTERSILQYFIDGYDIQQVSEKAFISLNTAKKHNTNINKKLQTTSREELRLYIELFRRCDCLEKIRYGNE